MRAAAVDVMVEAALAEARRRRTQMVMVQSLASSDSPLARQLTARGFVCVAIPPTVVVDLPYRSFGEYLAAMRAPYRRRARQVMERSDCHWRPVPPVSRRCP
jgi:hypothetical protein